MPRKRKTRNIDDNDSNWTCTLCTLQNPMRRRRCGACEAHRPLEEQPSAVSLWLKSRKRKRKESATDNNSPDSSTVTAVEEKAPNAAGLSSSSLTSSEPNRSAPCSWNRDSISLPTETGTDLHELPNNAENERELPLPATASEIESATPRHGRDSHVGETEPPYRHREGTEASDSVMKTTMGTAAAKGELDASSETAKAVVPAEAVSQEQRTSGPTCGIIAACPVYSSSGLPDKIEQAVIRESSTNPVSTGKMSSLTLAETEPSLENTTERTEKEKSEMFAEQPEGASRADSTAQVHSLVNEQEPTKVATKTRAGDSVVASAHAEDATGGVEPTTIDASDETTDTAAFTRGTKETCCVTTESISSQQKSSAAERLKQSRLAKVSGENGERDKLESLGDVYMLSVEANHEKSSHIVTDSTGEWTILGSAGTTFQQT